MTPSAATAKEGFHRPALGSTERAAGASHAGRNRGHELAPWRTRKQDTHLSGDLPRAKQPRAQHTPSPKATDVQDR